MIADDLARARAAAQVRERGVNAALAPLLGIVATRYAEDIHEHEAAIELIRARHTVGPNKLRPAPLVFPPVNTAGTLPV